MRKDQQLVETFVCGYNRVVNGSFRICDWPDVTERRLPAVEAIAKDNQSRTLAVEHTLMQPYAGEKEDTNKFRQVFCFLESDQSLRLDGYDIQLWPPVGAIPKGISWRNARETIEFWLRRNRKNFPAGTSVQRVLGLNFELSMFVKKEPHSEGSLTVGRSTVPNTLKEVISTALDRKLRKLVATNADKRILLLEMEIPIDEQIIAQTLESLSGSFTDLKNIDEIWVVDTFLWERTGTCWFKKVWLDGVSTIFEMFAPSGSSELPVFVKGRELILS